MVTLRGLIHSQRLVTLTSSIQFVSQIARQCSDSFRHFTPSWLGVPKTKHRPQTNNPARMRNRDRETRTKWDDRSTLFPDGLRLKAPVRSQHQDVCRAHACRETTGMTTDPYTRSPDSFSFSFFIFPKKKFLLFFFSCISFNIYFLLLALVSEFDCFLRSRCSMEMWCPDDIAGIGLGRLLGGEHASTPQSGVEALRLLKRSLSRLYCCC